MVLQHIQNSKEQITTRSIIRTLTTLLQIVFVSAALVSVVHARPSKILAGGYPSPQDFERLKLYEVTTIVSLLDPRLPEEEILLRTEEKLAKLYNMELIHRPMISTITGEWGSAYQSGVHDVSEIISDVSGVVYIHCYYGSGRTVSVIEELENNGEAVESFVSETQINDEAWVYEADQAYNSGDLTNAIVSLEALPLLDHRLQLMLGWSLYRTEDYGRALQVFEKLARRIPEMTEARTGVGFASMAIGDVVEAEKAFRSVLSTNNTDPDANMGMGMLRMEQSAFADAENHLKICVKQSPNNAEAQSLLAAVSNKLSNP